LLHAVVEQLPKQFVSDRQVALELHAVSCVQHSVAMQSPHESPVVGQLAVAPLLEPLLLPELPPMPLLDPDETPELPDPEEIPELLDPEELPAPLDPDDPEPLFAPLEELAPWSPGPPSSSPADPEPPPHAAMIRPTPSKGDAALGPLREIVRRISPSPGTPCADRSGPTPGPAIVIWTLRGSRNNS
jgi:hypothetical protein